MALEHGAVEQVGDDGDDEDFTPPVAVHVETDKRYTICPNCSRPMSKHSFSELMRCSEADGDDRDDDVIVPDEIIEPEVANEPEPEPEEPEPIDVTVVDQPEDEDEGLPPKTVALTAAGEIDYEELARAMRTVIERERDEVIKRGGPIEKQNAELKERLASALEDAAMWRRRCQMTAEQRNMLQAQLDDSIKTNRKLRNELKGRKESGNHQRVLELNDLLDAVRKEKGFTVERAGNGHFIVKKLGVFITDLASSGQGSKVNMASRVALRKAGIDV